MSQDDHHSFRIAEGTTGPCLNCGRYMSEHTQSPREPDRFLCMRPKASAPMRSTVQIICAVKDNKPVEFEELRLALLALSSIEHFYSHELSGLVEAIDEGKPIGLLRLKSQFAKDLHERMFKAIKTDPRAWLGEHNIPGNPEHDERLAGAKRLFTKATGETLE